MFNAAMGANTANIARFLATEGANSPIRVLDLGCWDGTSLGYLPKAWIPFGAELSETAAITARSHGLLVARCDLNRSLPFASEAFDAITSNQVIEHLCDTDTFLNEAFRVLRPGGRIAVSTENMSSWHNIASLVLGWQAFSLTNVSHTEPGLGNPLANFRGSEPFDKGWEHLRIFSFRGLRELMERRGFNDITILGAGYYPFGAKAATIDPRHSAFITAVGRRPKP